MAREAAEWLERHELFARTVTIKVRYSDFTTITRSHSARAGHARRDDLVRRALDLLDRTDAGRRPVRLLGVIGPQPRRRPRRGRAPPPPDTAAAVRRRRP